MASSVQATNASTTRAQFSSTRDPLDGKNRRSLIGLAGTAGAGSRARRWSHRSKSTAQHLRDPQLAASRRGFHGTANVQHPGPGFLKVSLPPSKTAITKRSKATDISPSGTVQKSKSFRICLTHNGHHRCHTAPGPARGRAQEGTGSLAAAAGRHWGHLGQAATLGQGEALCSGVLHNRVSSFL